MNERYIVDNKEPTEVALRKMFPVKYDYKTLRRVNKVVDSYFLPLSIIAASGVVGFIGGIVTLFLLLAHWVPEPASISSEKALSLEFLLSFFFMGAAIITAIVSYNILSALVFKIFIDRYENSFSEAYALNAFLNKLGVTVACDKGSRINFLSDFHKKAVLLAPGDLVSTESFTSNGELVKVMRVKRGILFEIA